MKALRTYRSVVAGATAVALLALGACGAEEEPGTDDMGPVSPSEPSAPESSETITLSRGQEHRIGEEGEFTLHCDGGGQIDIDVTAVVTVTGSCEEIDVDADAAAIHAEDVEALDIDANEVEVEAGAVGDLDVEGHGNVVSMRSVREIDVDGRDNTIRYAQGSPDIDQEGSGNRIERG